MSELGARIEAVRKRIDTATARAGREPGAVSLLAVSKTRPLATVLEAHALGLHAFGENRVQEGIDKVRETMLLEPRPEWHLIGGLQRNKVRRAVEFFDVLQSVDRPELVREIEKATRTLERTVRVMIQVNVDDEPQKSGVAPAELADLVAQVDACDRVTLEGLMAIPRACEDPEEVRPSFRRLRELLAEVNATRDADEELVQLSMGMTADFEVAIEEGSTCVRVGTAIFGPRSTTENT